MMNIDHIRANNLHEKYILNQMDVNERDEYEAFLRNHPEAQRESDAARRMIDAIRQAGHNRMKKEITDQVAAINNRKIDWGMYYKLAAVLFLFVLLPSVIYIQNRQITGAIEPNKTLTENVLPLKSTPHPAQPAIREKKETLKTKLTSGLKPVKTKIGLLSRQNTKASNNASRIKEKISALGSQKQAKISASGSGKIVEDAVRDVDAFSAPQTAALNKTGRLRARSGQNRSIKSKSAQGIIAGEQLNPANQKKVYRYKLKSSTLVFTLLRSAIKDKAPDTLSVYVRYQKDSTLTLTARLPNHFYSLPQSYIYISKHASLISVNFNNQAQYQVDIDAKKPTMILLDKSQ